MRTRGAVVISILMAYLCVASASALEGEWSPFVHGLQARIVIIPPSSKVESYSDLVPHLELRNADNNMFVDCSEENISIDLVDESGEPVKDVQGPVAISGPGRPLGIIYLPMFTTISMSLEQGTAAIGGAPKDGASIASPPRVLEKRHNGKVFLRARLKGAKERTKDGRWFWTGTLQIPDVRVTWK